MIPRLALTPGEPAGVGPDLCIEAATRGLGARLIAIADPDLLAERAKGLGRSLTLIPWEEDAAASVPGPGSLYFLPIRLRRASLPGRLDPANAGYVLDALRTACEGCLAGRFDALVTGPVHKGVINDAGLGFTGHTEFLADCCGAQPVMMLAAPGLRVALATTHLPLSQVAAHITRPSLERIIRTLQTDLRSRFCIGEPRILVCGLNPHAGEGGYLGHEEREIITPVVKALRAEGMALVGPVPADSAFVPDQLDGVDAVLAMYHDQGLPVLKHMGFGRGINITLGLPIIRTSVDHGTALGLAGTGNADPGSLLAAIATARDLANTR